LIILSRRRDELLVRRRNFDPRLVSRYFSGEGWEAGLGFFRTFQARRLHRDEFGRGGEAASNFLFIEISDLFLMKRLDFRVFLVPGGVGPPPALLGGCLGHFSTWCLLNSLVVHRICRASARRL